MGTSLAATPTFDREPPLLQRRSDLLDVEIVIPVHNESLALEGSVRMLHGYLSATFPPLVEDEAWFFDTELLALAQRRGLRIHEVPVDWVQDGDSRVEIVPTALADLRGVARLLVHQQPSGDSPNRAALPSPGRPMLAP